MSKNMAPAKYSRVYHRMKGNWVNEDAVNYGKWRYTAFCTNGFKKLPPLGYQKCGNKLAKGKSNVNKFDSLMSK